VQRIFIIVIAILITCSCQFITDESDKEALKRHFEIPEDAEMIAYDGSPPMSGFGQREGLTISAKYSIKVKDMNRWITKMKEKGLRKLPIEPECRRKLWIKDKLIPLETQTGYYYCRTAGNDVLNATETKPCNEVDYLKDIILALLDTEKNELSVIIKSGY
jgi:hypothetical protein